MSLLPDRRGLPPVPRPDARLVADLAADVAAVPDVAAVLDDVAAAALHRERPAAAARSASGSSPAEVLLRVFVLGRPVTRAALDAALPRTGTAGAAALGLVAAAGAGAADAVRAQVDLRPYTVADAAGEATWWLASDLGSMVTGRELDPGNVLGVGGATTTLARSTIRTPVGRTLDLGTGCGIQALHASRHSDAVVATDLSHRALGFAAFNAALAGVGLDLREGSMLEPVTGERFDLVVSNPPFVISPPGFHRFEYRDGGRTGDALVADLVGGLGSVLAPGGTAELLGNWEHRRGQPWTERVGAWLDASGLDGWVVQREVLDPAEYAELWLRDGGATREQDPAGWDAATVAWLDDFAARGVEAVGLGLVVLRRPASGGRTLRRLEAVTSPVRDPLGGHLASVLAAHDWLAARDDTAVLDARLVVAPDVTEERHQRPGAVDPEVILLRQGGGFGRAVPLGTAEAGFVGACDGDLTVGQISGGLAVLLDVPAADLRDALVPLVRDLVRDAFLLPA
jgi:hypothetical protein